MKVKIVKFNNGKYAVRKGWWFFRYADIVDMKRHEQIYWWWDDGKQYTQHYTTSDLDTLEKLIENYKRIDQFKVERVMSVHKLS